MAEAIAEFSDVVKEYPTRMWGRARLRALDRVSLRIEPGEVFGLLGPNRAGKTTLVKLLLTLCRPSAGTIHRLGKPADDRRTLRHVGYVHENPAFPRHFHAEGLLEFYGALTLLPEEVVKARVPPMLQRLGLHDRGREPITRFSKGMLQRLGLAQALLNQPRLLILDEPSEGLDLAGRQLLRDIIRETKARGGSVLYVSHVLSEIEQVCDRVGVLVSGRFAFLGPMAELTQDPHTGMPRSLEAALNSLYPSP